MTFLHHWTPTFDSLPLQKKTGQRIWLKMENYQPTGSYKIRGIGRLCQAIISNGERLLISSSGGNAGAAVAYAGRQLGVPAVVFLPTSSNQLYIDAIKAEGAEVCLAGEVWDEANSAALTYQFKKGGAYIPPFDHPLIWAGHATIIDEVVAQGIQPEAIVVSVGGGGLACGILQGMSEYGWDKIPVFAVETEGAASFAASVVAQKVVTLANVSTLATTLAAKRITQNLFNWHLLRPVHSLVVSDYDAVLACEQILNDHRILVEPATGAALSVVYNRHIALASYASILVIVCGGIGISLPLLQSFLTRVRQQ